MVSDIFSTEGAKAFWNAWVHLRGKNLMPHYRDLFDGLDSKLIPQTVILEHNPGTGYVVRFVGTGIVTLWGIDKTDKNMTEVMPAAFMEGLAKLFDVLRSVPCGSSSLAQVDSGRGVSLKVDVVMLPVANDPQKPDRIALYMSMVPPPDGDALDTTSVRRAGRIWIDIGAGVPSADPPQ